MRLDNMTPLEVAKTFAAICNADACHNCIIYKHYGDTDHCKSADCDMSIYKFLTEDEDMLPVKKFADKIGIHKLYSLVCELRGE